MPSESALTVRYQMQGRVRERTLICKCVFDSTISNIRACLTVPDCTSDLYDRAQLEIPLNLYEYSTILINAHNWVSYVQNIIY